MLRWKSKATLILFGVLLLLCCFKRLPNPLCDTKSGSEFTEIISPNAAVFLDVTYQTTTGNAYAVWVEGDYAYVADGESGLAVINVTDPNLPGTPQYEATASTEPAIDCLVEGDMAFVYCVDSSGFGNGVFASYNISDPINPQAPTEKEYFGKYLGFTVDGDYAYFSGGGGDFTIYNITDFANIQSTGGTWLPGGWAYQTFKSRLCVNLEYAYVADYYGDLQILNITNPGTAPVVSHVPVSGNARSVWVEDDVAFISTTAGLSISDISNPRSSVVNSSLVERTISGGVWDLWVEGDLLFATVGTAGVAIYNIADPFNPHGPFYIDTNGEVQNIFLDGGIAYVAAGSAGLAIINLTRMLGAGAPIYVPNTQGARDVWIEGNVACVAQGYMGFSTFDVSNPKQAQKLDEYTYIENGTAYTTVTVKGDYAFTFLDKNEDHLFDISDPSNIIEIVTGPLPGGSGACIAGDAEYVAQGGDSGALGVFNVSNPYDVTQEQGLMPTGAPMGVWVEGDILFIACNNSGLLTYNITNRWDPVDPIYTPMSGRAQKVIVIGDWAFVAAGDAGLATINITNPRNPMDIHYSDTDGFAYDVWVAGNHAFVADGSAGLAIINISNPASPGAPSYVNTDGTAYSVFLKGDYAYVADGAAGLAVIPLNWYNFAPYNLAIQILGGVSSTQIDPVTLTLAATWATEYTLSNDNVTWSSWKAYTTSTTWSLSPQVGTLSAYYKTRNALWEESGVVNASINTTAPTGISVVINGGDVETTNNVVTLTITGGQGAAQMTFSVDGSTWTSWETFQTSKVLTLRAGNGTREAFVRVRNHYGEVSASDSIEYFETSQITLIIIIAVVVIGGVVGVVAFFVIRARRTRKKVAAKIDGLMDEFETWEETGKGKKQD